jgi:class 3 adenylate cyclase
MTPRASGATADDGQQQPAAILITDIVGSTQYFEQHGNSAGVAMVERHNAIVLPMIEQSGGRVIKTMGDGVLAIFGHPVEAIRAAVGVQTQLRLTQGSRPPNDRIHVRVGVHYGIVVAREGDVFGDAVNLTERVKASADADQVRISEALRLVVRGDPTIEVRSVGRARLKGVTEEVELFEVTSAPLPSVRLPSIQGKERLAGRRWIIIAGFGLFVLLLAVGVILLARRRWPAGHQAAIEAQHYDRVAVVWLRVWGAGSAERELPIVETERMATGRASGATWAPLPSGAQFQLCYLALVQRYVYAAFFHAGRHQHTLVFPHPDTILPLPQGTQVTIPSEGTRFVLDRDARTETIVLIVSQEPIRQLKAGTGLRETLEEIKSFAADQVEWDCNPASVLAPSFTDSRGRCLVMARPANRLWIEVRIDHR